MITSGKNPDEFRDSQGKDLLGRLRSTEFVIQIAHGDFPVDGKHRLKLFLTDQGKWDAHFELHGEPHPIGIGDITGLKVTNEKVSFDLFAHRTWERTFLIPIGVLVASVFIPKSHWIISSVATLCSGALATSFGKKVRFLCDLKDGRYFTAIVPAAGYEALRRLVEV